MRIFRQVVLGAAEIFTLAVGLAMIYLAASIIL
jgi:hypothetical protein